MFLTCVCHFVHKDDMTSYMMFLPGQGLMSLPVWSHVPYGGMILMGYGPGGVWSLGICCQGGFGHRGGVSYPPSTDILWLARKWMVRIHWNVFLFFNL